MSPSEGIPLRKIKEWPEEMVRKLEGSWITTVEQVIAMSSTPDGLHSLAEHFGISEEETRRLIAVARAYLPSEVAAKLEKPVDVGDYGLGALKPSSNENGPQDSK